MNGLHHPGMIKTPSLTAYLLLTCFLVGPRSLGAQSAKLQLPSSAKGLLASSHLAVSFEANIGQLPPNTRYMVRRPGYGVLFQPSGAIFKVNSSEASRASSEDIKLDFLGINPNAKPEGSKPVAFYSNYLIGNDSRLWHTHVPHFAEVRYPALYRGVDVVYYGSDGQLEFDFVVSPHSRTDQIAFSLEGIGAGSLVQTNVGGDLIVSIGEHKVIIQRPRLYQGDFCRHVTQLGASRDSCHTISGGGFLIHRMGRSKTQIRFALPRYDHSQTLVIDPVVAFSTYMGTGGGPAGMVLDANRNIYIVGATDSTDLPVTSNAFQKTISGNSDLFIMKLNSDATQILYLTYLGGSNAEYAAGIAIDSGGNAYVTGQTYSTDFPLAHPYQAQNLGADSAFVSKLSPDGSTLIYSTYLGGSSLTAGIGIAVDSSGEAAIDGWTYATDFPTVNAFQSQHAIDGGTYDGFVAKFAAGGTSLVFSTYLGGNLADLAAGISLDPAGNVYVTGTTNSTDFPTTPGAYQTTYVSYPGVESSFVSEFSPSGSIVYSTYLPASQATAIAVNASGNAFVTGSAALQFPVTAGAFQTSAVGANAFVTEFNSAGSSLVYSTFLGGNDIDTTGSIAVDSSNNVYVTGETSSLNFPLQFPVQTTAYGGVPNAFVSELNNAGSHLLFSTFLGGGAATGSGSQQGTAITVDSAGNIYVGGGTNEPDFPVINAYQPNLIGFGDGFLAKFLNEAAPAMGLNPTSLSFSPAVVNSISAPQMITVTNVGTAPLTLSSVTVSGSFSQTNNCSSAIADGASCSIQAKFTPSVFGPTGGTINITSNATLFPEVVPLSRTGQDFAFNGTPGGETVSPGQSAIVSLSLAPEDGFAQKVSLSCSGAPLGSSCLVSPSAVTLDGTDAVSATVTITTTARSAAVFFPVDVPSFAAVLVLPFAGILFHGARLKTPRKTRLALMLVVLFGSLLVACSGGGSGGSAVTPAGSYNVVVTATSGSLSHALEFSLTVN